MSEYQENCVVQSVERLTADLYRLALSAPLIASCAQPGQFVMANCSPSLDPLLRRPLSIHRCIDQKQVQLLFRIIGRGTALLATIQPGQSLNLIGPLGRGFRFRDEGPVCLVGGGIGIAPLLFLADRLQSTRRLATPCTVLLGSRTGADLTQLVQEFSECGCLIETATDDGSLGYHGLITDLLTPHLVRTTKVYTCGPHPMMAAVAALCQDRRVACEVSLEARMACGLGACLGCTVHGVDAQYRHVCKHGPVFKAEEVAWNR